MTKDVVVTIRGLQVATDEPQDSQIPLEIIQFGQYYEKNGTIYILYDEMTDDGKEVVSNVMKIKDRYFEVQKKGAVGATLIFEEGKSHRTLYQVSCGGFLLETDTHRVTIDSSEDRMDIKAEYELIINGDPCAECDIQVKVQSRSTYRLNE